MQLPKINGLVLLLSVLAWFSFSTALSAQSNNKQDDFFVEVPYRWTRGKIFVPVEINGKTYEFILDTGGKMGISKKLWDQLGLRKIQNIKATGIHGRKAKLEWVEMPPFKIGEATFSNINGWTSPFFEAYPVTCLEADGMIGRDLLVGLILQIDHQSQTLILTNQEERLTLDESYAVDMNLSGGNGPHIDLETQNGTIKDVMFDSGSDDILNLQRAKIPQWVGTNFIKKEEVVRVEGIFNLGVSLKKAKSSEQFRVWMPYIQFGDIRIEEFISDYSQESGSHIGTGILPFGKLTIDYKNEQFYFEPYEENKIHPSPVSTFGFTLRKEKNKLLVGGIYLDSPADRAGLKPGFKLLSINDIPADELLSESCENYRTGSFLKSLDQLDLTYLNQKGKEQTLSLSSYLLQPTK